MAKTAAQRQAKYRRAHTFRINMTVDCKTFTALQRLSRHHGLKKREMLEKLIQGADQKIIDALVVNSPAWDAYWDLVQEEQEES